MIDSTLRKVAAAALSLLPRGLVLPVLSGPLRGARWVIGSANNSNWVGSFESHTQRLFLAHVRPGDVVWDVGANVGFFSLLASRLVGDSGRVVAFEPFPPNLELLRRHVRMNHASNVDVVGIALASSPGQHRFALGEDRFSGRLHEEGSLLVDTATGDDLWTSRTVLAPKFIKMDIEGGESAALAGCEKLLRALRPILVLSAHGVAQFEHCVRLLEATRYEVSVEKDGASDGDYLLLAHAGGVAS